MERVKDFAAAFSLGTLAFILYWKIQTGDGYFSVGDNYFVEYLVPFAGATILALVSFTLMRWRFCHSSFVGRSLFGLFFSIVFFVIARNLMGSLQFPHGGKIWQLGWLCLSFVLFVSLLIAMKKNRENTIKKVRACLLIVFPFTVFTLFQDFRSIVFHKPTLAPLHEHIPKNKVVWFVFDEFDYHAAFEQRPEELNLVELDRFRSHAFFAQNAIQPGNVTFYSMPAYFSGIPTVRCDGRRNDILITTSGNKKVSWKNYPNIFEKAYSMGYNPALIGWHHAYSRVFGKSLTYCFENGMAYPSEKTKLFLKSFANALAQYPDFYKATLYKLIGREFTPTHLTWADVADVSHATHLERAKEILNDDSYNFVVIHWTIPHSPVIYNSELDELTNERGRPYTENLLLMDKTFGEMRDILEKKGQWESTTLVVTSDHWYKSGPEQYPEELRGHLASRKAEEGKVPVLVKLPGAEQGMNYEKKFLGHRLHHVVEQALKGTLSSYEDIALLLESDEQNTN